MTKEHRYTATTIWSGATTGYKDYARAHEIRIDGKPPIAASSDAALGGDAGRINPEDMLVGALSSCHMLWYLHLCAVKGVVVTHYEDAAQGVMIEEPGKGRFTQVTLRPVVMITAESDAALAKSLHERAHRECFIANSVNFPMKCEPVIAKAKAA
ncbi:MAG TPA: OsmC family protein [Alphaproteobacteria bacterium]|nr:OsmC family protein [Alphaproteobacteria bacterium]